VTASPGELYLVIDVGLTNVKAVVLSATGREVAIAAEPYETKRFDGRAVEQDPNEWWRAARRAIGRIPAGVRKSVTGVVVTGHMHALVILDSDGRLVRDAMVLGDTRARTEAMEIRERLGDERIYGLIGTEMDASLPAAKIRYLASHEPDSYRRASSYLGCKDYIRYRLTGDVATDPTDACATGLYDIRSGTWAEELLAAAAVGREQLPPIRDAASLGGVLHARAAEALGLRTGIPVSVGAGDDVEILGHGVVGSADVVEHLGTTGALFAPARALVLDPSRAVEIYPDPAPPGWVLGAAMTTAGGAIDWAMRLLGYARLEDAVGSLAVNGRSTIHFSPHMAGRRFPYRDPAARGGWSGIELSATREDLMQAVLTGTAFALRQMLEHIEAVGGGGGDVHGVGSSPGMRAWDQHRADIYGRRLILAPPEPTARGSLALLLAATGAHTTVREAAAAVAQGRETIDPDPIRSAAGSERYRRFLEVEASLSGSRRAADAPLSVKTLVGHVADPGLPEGGS